ncbi:silent information regulator family protein [Naegleria gruberi]|uniref:protein acetyllysine N-acetyltransferase n=1 Tax=Naegleria gruberi TaxID=5762 RepID=D2VDV6_NAEGR|nr:silent information regulator family protein [Naegleria gruberi]EFC45062.1 silent information regulator family protein [Naegleria gruberi]|eukprot:XP_002677806.1 silent information regulator family protein [Naegleria gruberi strain NEG-M]
MEQEDCTEYFDSAEEIEEKIKWVIDYVKDSKHLVIYTGAGISTESGIIDYRGPKGIWTMLKQGKEPVKSVPFIKFPTKCHMAISELYKQKKLKYLTSQNVDGLHLESGISRDCMSEIHGNTNIEICKECEIEYVRDYSVRNNKEVHEHTTGRFCNKCGKELFDTIVNFNDPLDQKWFERALEHSKLADVAIVLGTSLKVLPICDLPQLCKFNTYGHKGKLIIVNLQTTPKDIYADVKINMKTDEFMERLMNGLGYQIPTYVASKSYLLSIQKQQEELSFDCQFRSEKNGNRISSWFKNVSFKFLDSNNQEISQTSIDKGECKVNNIPLNTSSIIVSGILKLKSKPSEEDNDESYNVECQFTFPDIKLEGQPIISPSENLIDLRHAFLAYRPDNFTLKTKTIIAAKSTTRNFIKGN